jgi:hypothetical protein
MHHFLKMMLSIRPASQAQSRSYPAAFNVVLSNPVNATLGTSTGVVSINATPGSQNGTLGAADAVLTVSGNKLVNSAGAQIQPRGVNVDGLEYTGVGLWSPADPFNGLSPVLAALQSWKINTVRLPLTTAIWFGQDVLKVALLTVVHLTPE